MKEVGYTKEKSLALKVIISTCGSGQMQPLIMNGLIQQNPADVGIKGEFEVVEWNSLLANWRADARDTTTRGGSIDERLLLQPGPVYRANPALRFQPDRTARHQLGLIQRCRNGRIAQGGAQ